MNMNSPSEIMEHARIRIVSRPSMVFSLQRKYESGD
jgi:hypothetical protein